MSAATPHINPATPCADEKAHGKSRGRRAIRTALPKHCTLAANHSESQSLCDTHYATALGGDGEALKRDDNHPPPSLAVANPDPSPAKARGRQAKQATQPMARAPVGSPSESQVLAVTQGPLAPGGDGGAHLTGDIYRCPSLAVAEIIQLWRMRQRWHRAEKALLLQGRALCRGWTEGDKAEANRLFDAASAGEAIEPGLAMALAPFLAAIVGFGPERSGIEKRLRKLARELPFWAWVSGIKGFGDLNLAALVGEAGEIASYRNPSCLWKRMGLAVIGGERQRRKTDAAEAEAHGYNPKRRTVAYLLSDTLIKAGDGNRYRLVYTERRAHTAETHPDWTKAHSHNDAARVMVKRVLRDLWIEARRVAQAEGR